MHRFYITHSTLLKYVDFVPKCPYLKHNSESALHFDVTYVTGVPRAVPPLPNFPKSDAWKKS